MEIFRYAQQEQKKTLLESFSPKKQTWVVSDLTSKFEIQKKFLLNFEILEEDCVLRASELWQKMFIQQELETRLISLDLMKNIIFDWLDQKNLDWVKSSQSTNIFLDYFHQLLPLLNNDLNFNLLKDWFRENPESYLRWGHWMELSFDFWLYIQDKKVILSQWIPAYLLKVEPLIWSREIIFDVGVDLTAVESDLLSKMSLEGQKIKVLKPGIDLAVGSWIDKYQQQLWPYDILSEESFSFDQLKEKGTLQVKPEKLEKIELHHFSTTVSEIKFLCAKIRALLDQGVSIEQVAIVHSNIEMVWPVLRYYLEVEGLPFDKSVLARSQSLPSVHVWLSKLRLSLKKMEFSDLENCLYTQDHSPGVPLDRFYQLFQQIYDYNDLKRENEIYQFVKKEVEIQRSAQDIISRDEFVIVALRYWENLEEIEIFHKIWSTYFVETPVWLKLKLSSWVHYIENMVSHIEIPINEENHLVRGIFIGNLNAIQWLEKSYWFCLGAEECSLRKSDQTGLSFSEVMKLSMDLGLHLTFPDQLQNEFHLRSLLEKKYEQLHLSYSSSDLLGEVQAPSRLFLRLSLDKMGQVVPAAAAPLTRWDEIQRASLEQIGSIRGFDSSDLFEQVLQQDLGIRKYDKCLSSNRVRLSASLLESYLFCPFKFTAERLFQLVDWPQLDFDLDHLSRGQFVHSLFETLLQEPINNHLSDEELGRIIDKCMKNVDIKMMDPSFWPLFKNSYIELSKRFLNFEKKWREDFPTTKTLAKEEPIQAYWDQNQKDFLTPREFEGLSDPEKSLLFSFKGYIDRIDGDDKNHLVVIDYKSSIHQASNFKSWVENDKLQMSLYSYLLEKGCVSGVMGHVVAAHYYYVKTQKRNIGFNQNDPAIDMYEKPNAFNSINSETKVELYKKTLKKVSQIVSQIQEGYIQPEPSKIENCKTCHWSQICRAPHLQ